MPRPRKNEQLRYAEGLVKDYIKFKGFRACDYKEPSNEGKCNMCPIRYLPPCRDETRPEYNINDRGGEPGPRWFRECGEFTSW